VNEHDEHVFVIKSGCHETLAVPFMIDMCRWEFFTQYLHEHYPHCEEAFPPVSHRMITWKNLHIQVGFYKYPVTACLTGWYRVNAHNYRYMSRLGWITDPDYIGDFFRQDISLENAPSSGWTLRLVPAPVRWVLKVPESLL